MHHLEASAKENPLAAQAQCARRPHDPAGIDRRHLILFLIRRCRPERPARQRPVFNAVSGGRYGESPSLTALDQSGNLVHTVDYRSVYATVLDSWLEADADTVLGSTYERLPVLT